MKECSLYSGKYIVRGNNHFVSKYTSVHYVEQMPLLVFLNDSRPLINGGH